LPGTRNWVRRWPTATSTWRLITLAMSKPDGGRLDIELLRPVEWLEHVSADVGRTVELDLAELGAAGPAGVLSIAPCPEIEPDDGTGRRVITGTFRHSSGNIYDIQIAGEPAPIGTTGNHPSCFSQQGDGKNKVKDIKDEELKQFPVEQVSWNDCQEFLKKLNEKEKGYVYRLPTEEEWEYACRGGATTEDEVRTIST